MKALRARYTPEAVVLIRKLHPEIKHLVRKGIRTLLENPLLGHELQLDLSGFRSYRIRNYRVVYQINSHENFLEVYFVGHRRDVYESFRALLLEKETE
jgi:mRNA interferase RelE/StbE